MELAPKIGVIWHIFCLSRSCGNYPADLTSIFQKKNIYVYIRGGVNFQAHRSFGME